MQTIGPDTRCRDVTTSTLSTLATELRESGLSTATTNRRISGLRTVLGCAYDADEIDKLPRYRKMRESNGRSRTLTESEYKGMCDKMYSQGHAHSAELVIYLYNTGCRVSEARKLRREDICPDYVFVRDTKSGKDRRVYTNPTISEKLKSCELLQGDRPFDISSAKFSRHWIEARSALGHGGDAEFVPHALRHTFATRLVKEGVPLHTVSTLLGHSSLQMTMRYAHAADSDLTAAVNKLTH
jgi:integrase